MQPLAASMTFSSTNFVIEATLNTRQVIFPFLLHLCQFGFIESDSGIHFLLESSFIIVELCMKFVADFTLHPQNLLTPLMYLILI